MTTTQRETTSESVGPNEEAEADAFRHLSATIDRYESPLLRYTMGLLRRCPDQAQDVVQETFLRYHRARLANKPIANPSSWLYRVAHNLAIDLYRREHRTSPLDDEMLTPDMLPANANPSAEPQPGAELGRRETCDLALAELQRLPEDLRDVVLLKIVEGRTLAEVGELTGLKIGTVHYRLCQGLKELTRRLHAQGAL